MNNIHDILELALRHRASDVLLKAGASPAFRIDGTIVPTKIAPLEPEGIEDLVRSIIFAASRDYMLRIQVDNQDATDIDAIAERHFKALASMDEVDLVFTIPGLMRVRANLFVQASALAAVLRLIPLRPLPIEELNLPPVLRELANNRQGLILVTGPTGSGKSTTLAAMLEHINATRQGNIITIEDPVEFLYEDKYSVVFQREVGRDTRSYSAGLHSVLRQSPDVILIGEMRDPETMAVAMMAAEMGHLVMSSIHSTSASHTVDRIIAAFPPHERTQVRTQLANSLLAVISQRLLKRSGAPGRVPAVEVMINTPTIRKHVEEGNPSELYAAIRDGRHFGMNTMNQALERLHSARLITTEDAIAATSNATELRQMLRQGESART